MPHALTSVGQVDAALVGEPTNLQPSVAQRGLMMADLVARGDQRHAGYAAEGGFTNAAVVLARDLVKLGALCQERVHRSSAASPSRRRSSRPASAAT